MPSHVMVRHSTFFRRRPIMFLIALALVALFGLGLIPLVAWFLQSLASRIEIGEHDVLIEKGLLSKSRSEMAIASIRTVRVRQSLLNRMFGVGDVRIFTGGDKPEGRIDGVGSPNLIRQMIRDRQAGHSSAPNS